MQQDLFASKTEPSFIREHVGQLNRIPNREKSMAKKLPEKPSSMKGKFVHFALVHFNKQSKLPPMPKKPKEKWPDYCFMNHGGLPYMKFADKKAIDDWFSKTGGSNKPFKIWTCTFCKQLHFIPFPIDDSTSGKTPRVWEFLIKMGHSPEEVYGLATTTK